MCSFPRVFLQLRFANLHNWPSVQDLSFASLLRWSLHHFFGHLQKRKATFWNSFGWFLAIIWMSGARWARGRNRWKGEKFKCPRNIGRREEKWIMRVFGHHAIGRLWKVRRNIELPSGWGLVMIWTQPRPPHTGHWLLRRVGRGKGWGRKGGQRYGTV